MPGPTSAQRAVTAHVREFFAGREVDVLPFDEGPIREHVPGFQVLRAAGDDGLWTYVTCGVWDGRHEGEHGLELCLIVPEPDDRHVQQLAWTAYYHADPDPSFELDLGHTVPIGKPFAPGSALDHFLVSLPYPHGPDFERCAWSDGHARLLWLLPITKRERDFRGEHGLEALEQRFDAAGIAYWDPARPSVV